MSIDDKPEALPAAQLAALGIPASAKHPLDLLFSLKDARIQTQTVRAHVTNANLSHGSLLRLTADVCIVSPELCFL